MNPSPRRVRRVLAVALGVGLLAGVAVGPVAAGDGTPNGRASCLGIEQAVISPPGSSDEVPGGAAQLSEILREVAAGLGVPPGAIFSFIATLHEGSHEACDAVIG